jgi:uncharacterized protein (DUF1778 family)
VTCKGESCLVRRRHCNRRADTNHQYPHRGRARTLIDRAARAAGKDRTQVVLDAATREATTVLLDQRYFQLDTAAFAKFNAALDASPAENPRLRELLSRKAPWER